MMKSSIMLLLASILVLKRDMSLALKS
jgi:hypothetical protein